MAHPKARSRGTEATNVPGGGGARERRRQPPENWSANTTSPGPLPSTEPATPPGTGRSARTWAPSKEAASSREPDRAARIVTRSVVDHAAGRDRSFR